MAERMQKLSTLPFNKWIVIAARHRPHLRQLFIANPFEKATFWMTRTTCLLLITIALFPACALAEPLKVDVAVYGGSSAGVAAAVQVARMGKSVVLIEPGSHIGGLTSGGLGATDIGNKAAIGGLSREFYTRIAEHYARDDAWVHQRRQEYRSSRKQSGDHAMWTFEPHVAENVFLQMLHEHNINVLLNSRLARDESGISLAGNRVQSIRLESGQHIAAAAFIDCTYEGDLMALAGVTYIVGRESNAMYDETLNGVQTAHATKHQLMPKISPFVIATDPASGLLPGIEASSPAEDGSQDHRVQAYCLRMCNTQHASNMLPFAKPETYDAADYELLFRNFAAGAKVPPWHAIGMPNFKTDTNNNRGFSTDYIGASYTWAEASYTEREQIYRDHLAYQQGLMWTLANHPRVPKNIREYFRQWGNCADEFVDNGGWPTQLYVREARRMQSEVVITQHHCQGRITTDRPIGLAAYTMDSHNVQRYVNAEGFVANEGDVQVGGFPPYGIDYRAIVPKESECENVLVPVCFSASHIAYGSVRMEPVFMVLGQSAASAACLAIDDNCSVQQLRYDRLRTQLLRDGQRLEFAAPVHAQSK